MLALAKLLVRLSVGEYTHAFHVHQRSDFSGDGDQPDVLAILLIESVDWREEDQLAKCPAVHPLPLLGGPNGRSGSRDDVAGA
jgi:hypothetical protein